MVDSSMIAAHLNPVFGIKAIPITGGGVYQNPHMRPREVLAANLKALMSASTSLRTLPELIAATGGKVTNGTLDRIRRAESATTVDTLEPIAAAFGLEPWQLLVPGLRADPGPDGRALISGLPDWPFEMVDRLRYQQLPELSRAYAQAKLAAAIEEREAAPPPLRTVPSHDSEVLAQRAILSPRRRTTPGKDAKRKK